MRIPKRPNLAEDIADYLADKIICIELKPGEQIREAKAKEKFKVSNGPIREAFQILEKYHLVEIIPRKGVRVTELSADFVRCLFEIMTELIGFIIRRLCENRTEEELNNLLELQDKAVNSAEKKDIAGYFTTTVLIMQIALDVSRNPLLAKMVQSWLPSLRRAYFLSLSHSEYNIEDSVAALLAVSEHVSNRDPVKGEEAIRSYLHRERERVLEIIEKYSPDGESIS